MKNYIALAFLILSQISLFALDYPDFSQLPIQTNPPDPLTLFDGQPVTSKKDWFNRRRPELKALFQHYEYGFFPPPAKTSSKLSYADTNYFNGKATLKLVTLTFGPPPVPAIHLMLVIPNHRAKPASVFLGENFDGNYTVVTNPNVPMPTNWVRGGAKSPWVVNNRATEAGRGQEVDKWAIEQSIDRGYAVATFYCGDIEPDMINAEGGVRETLPVPHSADSWGTIAAWAWGLQRAVDYLVTDHDLDKKRIALVGHSRLGKTALVAAAFDDRVALVVPLQAGCGGTSPSRGKIGESVKKINTAFPHWFCDNFKQFNEQPERLPFDQDCLIALCAPRPVLLACATGDTWSNPPGQFEMLCSADAVYRLVGKEGVESKIVPKTGHLMNSTLGYYIRPGKHSMTKEDWKVFLDFADKQLRH